MHTKQVHISEEELIELLVTKNENGLKHLYENYSGALYGIILRMVESEAVASDILQETFIKVWQSIEGYNSERGRLFTWMSKIARNKSIDYKRSKVSKEKRLTGTLQTIDDESIDELKDYSVLSDALNSLSPEVRLVVELVYYRGFTHSDASDYLDIPLGTIKTRVRKGLIELRKILLN